MQRVPVAVIGLGRIGLLHACSVHEKIDEAELVAVVEPQLNPTAEAWLKGHPEIRLYESVEQLLLQKNIQAVLICSATHTHAQFIEEAARAGKHIFCEKPIDLSIERIQQVLSVVEGAEVKLQTGFQRRFDTNFRTIQQGIVEGKIGQPHFLRICSRDPDLPSFEYIKVSGGLFLDMSVHDFDMARFLFGEIAKVEARATTLVDQHLISYEDVDTAVVILHFENGALGVIDNSRRAVYGYDQRIEAFGSKGMLMCDNNFPHSVEHWSGEQLDRVKPYYFFTERYHQAYKDEIVSFIEAISQNKPVAVSGYDGLRAVEIGYQALQSHRQNQEKRETV